MHGAPVQGALSDVPVPGQGVHQACRGSAEQAGQSRPDDLFTGTMSHKMVQGALSQLKGQDTIIERCHTSSLSALRGILEKHAG